MRFFLRAAVLSAAWCSVSMLSLASASAAPTPPSEKGASAISALNVAAIDQVVMREIASGRTAGLAVGVLRKGGPPIVRNYGYADLEHSVAVKDATVFPIGSATKQFTAAGIMKLAERGQLAIDDPLSRYLPNFPRAKQVTLRQLLNHTSGIRDMLDQKDRREVMRLMRRDFSTSELAEYVSRLPDLYDFEPGTAWRYSNSGYVLLGAVIERVSGEPYEVFVRRHIAEPLRLRSTAVDDLASVVAHRAEGYNRSRGSAGQFVNAIDVSRSSAGAAGSMRSTALDMLRWHAALFGAKLLSQHSIAAMTTPSRLSDGRLSSEGWIEGDRKAPPFDYGLGFIIERQNGRLLFGHGGGLPGFQTWIRTIPAEEITVVVLANTGGAAQAIGPKVLSAILSSDT